MNRRLKRSAFLRLGERCFHRGISGGERQLALIAWALVQRAPVLMLDEPTASLDFWQPLLVLGLRPGAGPRGYTVSQTTHTTRSRASCFLGPHPSPCTAGRVLTEGGPDEVLMPELMRELSTAWKSRCPASL